VLRHGDPVEVEIDGEHRSLWLVFVGNCRYEPEGMAPTRRTRLDDGELDVRLVDASHPYCRTRLVLAALTGTLRRSRVFQTWRTTGLHVRAAGLPVRLARDGETFDGADEFDIAKDGSRLAVLVPPSPAIRSAAERPEARLRRAGDRCSGGAGDTTRGVASRLGTLPRRVPRRYRSKARGSVRSGSMS
jgi:hypothetical protein